MSDEPAAAAGRARRLREPTPRWSRRSQRYAGARPLAGLSALGRRAGSEEAQRWGVEANANPPVLRTHDRYGHRVDEVDFHPSWHALMDVAVGEGLHGARLDRRAPAAHLRRAAGFVVWSQVEAGHGCPVSMTYAAVPALRTDPALAAAFEPGLTAHVLRPRAAGTRRPRAACSPGWA